MRVFRSWAVAFKVLRASMPPNRLQPCASGACTLAPAAKVPNLSLLRPLPGATLNSGPSNAGMANCPAFVALLTLLSRPAPISAWPAKLGRSEAATWSSKPSTRSVAEAASAGMSVRRTRSSSLRAFSLSPAASQARASSALAG